MSTVYMSAVYLPLLLSAATLLICIISFVYLKSYLKRRTRLQFLREEVLSEIREEVTKILRAIDETTERDISLIEEREKELKSLLDEIEKRLKVYIREMETRKEADEVYAKAASQVSQNDGTYLELGKNRYRINTKETVAAETEPQYQYTAFPLPAFSVKPEEGPLSEYIPTTAEQIRELLRAGFPAPVIASRLGISIAEAEFAAALYERRDNDQN